MMKFITEEYLRDLYKREPFSTYKLNQGQRLTPGGREYLSDRGIRMEDNVFQVNKKVPEVKVLNALAEGNKKIPEVKVSNVSTEGNIKLKKKLCRKLKSMEAIFLVTSSEILKEDIILAQNVINLGKKISNMRNTIEGKNTLESIVCKPCTQMTLENFQEDIDDCFEITEFHMQLEGSDAILRIHSLRCALREIGDEIMDAYEDNDDDFGDKIIGNVNSIINSLSQMICSTVGGIKCQRKS